MNKESPLVPQGSFLERKNNGRARFKIAVFVVLAIHGIGLVALLMQGCQKPPDSSSTAAGTSRETNKLAAPVAPSFVETTDAPVVIPETTYPTTPPVVVQNSQAPPNTQTPITQTPVVTETPQPPIQAGAATEYKIVAGDNLSKIAKDHKVSVKAIEAANPGIDAKHLKIGTTLQIPAPIIQPSLSSETPGTVAAPMAADGGMTYKVKSGDTLSRIASKYGVSVGALRTANGLRTDRIRVNQVLKIPGKNTEAKAPDTTGPR